MNMGHASLTRSSRTQTKGLYNVKRSGSGRYRSRKKGSTKRGGTSRGGMRQNQLQNSGGALGCIVGIFALGGIIAIGFIILYFLLIAALLLVAYAYYKANKELDPDQAERMASLLYSDSSEKNTAHGRFIWTERKVLRHCRTK